MQSYSQRRKMYGKIITTGMFVVALASTFSGKTDAALSIFGVISFGAVMNMWSSL